VSKEEKSRKYSFLVFKSTSLWRVLVRLRKHYKTEREPQSLVVPYVLTCAAYLESKLNDSLLQFALEQYGRDVASALMSLSLPNKLDVLVPVLTKGRYGINKEHFVYQRLSSLIRARNSITHAKSEVKEVEAAPEDLLDIPILNSGMTKMPRQFMDEPDITLGASKTFTPLEFHDALSKLERWFFYRCPDRLAKIAMVVARPKEEQWPATTMYAKFLD
jgi:hypothetical protein